MKNMGSIIFLNSEEARKHLFEKGYVYVLRMWRKIGKAKAYVGDPKNKNFLCYVYVEFIKKIKDPRELEPYIDESGFNKIYEWIQDVKKSYRSFSANFLFKITLISKKSWVRRIVKDTI